MRPSTGANASDDSPSRRSILRRTRISCGTISAAFTLTIESHLTHLKSGNSEPTTRLVAAYTPKHFSNSNCNLRIRGPPVNPTSQFHTPRRYIRTYTHARTLRIEREITMPLLPELRKTIRDNYLRPPSSKRAALGFNSLPEEVTGRAWKRYECRLCLTLHNNEGNYLAHTQFLGENVFFTGKYPYVVLAGFDVPLETLGNPSKSKTWSSG
eukprot:502605-Prorocentrum_minimum.AAC.1